MRGNGVGTAIGRHLLRIAFDEMDMHRVFATCDPRNHAATAVLRKLGMHYEGRMRHTVRLADGWRDSSMCSILDTEWSHASG